MRFTMRMLVIKNCVSARTDFQGETVTLTFRFVSYVRLLTKTLSSAIQYLIRSVT